MQNRLPARIFTVDIPLRERKIPPVRFPTQPELLSSRLVPGMLALSIKETCEEKL